jgi:hypothetical protein
MTFPPPETGFVAAVVLLPSTTIVGMGVGVEFDPQAARPSARMLATIKRIFFIWFTSPQCTNFQLL